MQLRSYDCSDFIKETVQPATQSKQTVTKALCMDKGPFLCTEGIKGIDH